MTWENLCEPFNQIGPPSAATTDNGLSPVAKSKHTIDGDSILASSKKYGDVTFSATVGTPNKEASLAFRMQDAANGYILNFVPVGSPEEPNGFVRLRKRTANDDYTRNLSGTKIGRDRQVG
jgi:hypothetical protein